jgi:hypothetical protein
MMFVKQGRINHKADKAKCLGPPKKKGPTRVKNDGKGAQKVQNEGKTSQKVHRTYENLYPALA